MIFVGVPILGNKLIQVLVIIIHIATQHDYQSLVLFYLLIRL